MNGTGVFPLRLPLPPVAGCTASAAATAAAAAAGANMMCSGM